MNITKIIILLHLLLFAFFGAFGQAVSSEPAEIDPTQPVKIIVNLNLTTNDWGIIEAAAAGEDMYIWTWKPFEHTSGEKVNGLEPAPWKNSNPLLKMTKETEGIYSFTLTPTEFYEVTAKEIYDNDIHFLIKPKDGGGFGDPDVKTEDLLLPVRLPEGVSKILFSMPNAYGPDLDSVKLASDDIFSIVYNINQEPKESMKDANSLYVYPVATGSDGIEYKIAANARRVADFPQLQLKSNGKGVFKKSLYKYQWDQMFNLPSGIIIEKINILVVKPNLRTSDDSSDQVLNLIFNNCP